MPVQPEQRLTELFERISHDMEAHEQEEIRQSRLARLSPAQIRYLDMIYHLENPTLSELAERVGSSKPTVTLTVEKLAENGLAEKVWSDADRRSAHIHLTAAGTAAAQEHEEIHRRFVRRISRRLTEEEQRNLADLLERGLGREAAE
jgi:DNA-binding MarR family transcriptional regulator